MLFLNAEFKVFEPQPATAADVLFAAAVMNGCVERDPETGSLRLSQKGQEVRDAMLPPADQFLISRG